jgi:hypothetical protein
MWSSRWNENQQEFAAFGENSSSIALSTSNPTRASVIFIIRIVLKEQEPRELSRQSDWLRAGRLRGRSSSPGRVKNFLFSTSSRPALRFTQPPIQWVQGDSFPGVKWPGRETDTHLQLVPRSRWYGSTHPLSHTSPWHNVELFKHRDNFIFYLKDFYLQFTNLCFNIKANRC